MSPRQANIVHVSDAQKAPEQMLCLTAGPPAHLVEWRPPRRPGATEYAPHDPIDIAPVPFEAGS